GGRVRSAPGRQGAGPDLRRRAAGRDQRGRWAGGLSHPYTEGGLTFERYYPPTGDGKAVSVDTLRDGLERAHDEGEKDVSAKRAWAKNRGVRYMVVVEDTVTV